MDPENNHELDGDHEHDEFCDHDHDEEMISICIEPRDDELAARGISREAFEAALPAAIDAYHDRLDAMPEDSEDLPAIEDAPVEVGGQTFRLGDLADLSLSEPDDEPGSESDSESDPEPE